MSLLDRRRRPTPLLLLAALLLSACSSTTNLVTGEQQRSAYTWQQEVELGRQADQQIVAQYGVYDDAQLSAYVDRIGQSVLQTSAYTDAATPAEIRATPFTFRVLDSPVVNAFALPGGYIYVTRGLLAHLDNEAQLAVVLGHEIGHVLGRHASEQAARAQLGQFGLLGAAVLGGVLGGGNVAQGILEYGSAGAQLLFLRYGRDAEREADQAGVAYAEFAGYDAAEAAAFFRSLSRLGAQSGGSLPAFLSTHPDPSEREQTIPQLAAQYAPGGTETNAAAFLAAIDGVVLGSDPRQGFTEGNRFYHPELRFVMQYPTSWRVNNGAAAVQFGEPNGRAAMELTFASESSAQAAASAFARQQGIQVTDQGATTVNGNRAYALSGSATTQQGALGFVVYFIEYGGRVYRLTGLAPAASFRSYAGAMEGAMRSFDRLTESRYLNRQPSRLDVYRTTRSASFRSFLEGRTLPDGLTQEGLAIMNQLDLTTTVPSGTSLKLPAR